MEAFKIELGRNADTNRKKRKLDMQRQMTGLPDEKQRGYEDDITDAMSRTTSNSRIIPYRLINASINREKPVFQQYLTSPQRIAIFTDKANPKANLANIEDFFTSVFRYTGSIPHFMRCVDTAQLHGYAPFEIRYDTKFPGLFKFIPHRYEDVIFPHCDDPNDVYVMYIRERYRQVEVQAMDIDEDKKDRIIKAIEMDDKVTYINKVYVKTADGYQIIFYSEQIKDFVSGVKPLFNGFPGSNMELNVFFHIYDQNDEINLNDKRGRAFYDADMQRASTVLLSAFAEKMFKSSSVYAGIDPGGASRSAEAAQLEVQLIPDTIINKPINFFSPPEPTLSGLSAINTIESMHAAQAGQLSFAANNRADSRKTAREISSAEQQGVNMDSLQLGNFSGFMSQLLMYSWKIVVAGVSANLILLPNTLTIEDFAKSYIIHPAGDVDYVKRMQKLQQMVQMLPMIAGSAYGNIFIRRIIEFAFPDEDFQEQFDKEQKQLELINALVQIAKAFLNSPNATNGLDPAQLQQAQQIVASAEQDVASGTSQLGQPASNPNIPQTTGGAQGSTPQSM